MPEGEQDFEADYPLGFAMWAISELDQASVRYFDACTAYAFGPTEENLTDVNAASEAHAAAFRCAAIALNSDASATEFHEVMENLLTQQDKARVTALNTALGKTVLETTDTEKTGEIKVFVAGDEEYMKLVIQNASTHCHTDCLSSDTQIFIDTVGEAA